MNFIKVLPATVVAMIFAGIGGSHAKATAPMTVTKTASSRTEVTFECGKSTSGQCTYILYSTVCEPSVAANGKTSLTCTHALIDEFSIKDGASRKFDKLPENYKSCVEAQGKKMTFAECVLQH
jgi:hypothetical protein